MVPVFLLRTKGFDEEESELKESELKESELKESELKEKQFYSILYLFLLWNKRLS